MTAQATKRFFAMVQNKLHWAIRGQTAAEVIVDRADATREHMGLRTWTDAYEADAQVAQQRQQLELRVAGPQRGLRLQRGDGVQA